MVKRNILVVLFVAYSCLLHATAPKAPDNCRILGYFSNLGIDTKTPRFSWTMNDPDRGEHQTAFEIIISDNEDDINRNNGSILSGGIIQSGNAEFLYNGKSLSSTTGYWWKVRIWDKDHQVSPWSKKNFFLTGFLKETDWDLATKWISAPHKRAGLSGAQWIWADPASKLQKTTLRSVLKIPSDKIIVSAQMSITADSAYILDVNGQKIIENNRWNVVQDLDLKDYLRSGDNILTVKAEKSSSPKRKGGVIARIEVRFTDGELLLWVTNTKQWTVINNGQTQPAAFIGNLGREPWFLKLSDSLTPNDCPPLLRKSFRIDKDVREAYLFISGLGVFEASLNGSKIGNQLIPPAWTDYDKTVNYVTFDVSEMLKKGENVLGVMLGNAWFDYQTQSLVKRHGLGETAPHIRNYGIMRLKSQLNIRYKDGTSSIVTSDPTWKTSQSPYTLAYVFGSEDYDARMEQNGWNTKDFSDKSWENAQIIESPSGILESQKVPPVIEKAVYRTITKTNPAPGVQVFDIGKNINGQYEIKVSGPAGSSIKIIPGEVLENGRVKPIVHKFPTYSVYTLKGKGIETCRLTFSTAGFRYIEISEVVTRKDQKDKPDIHEVIGHSAYSAAKETGNFKTSDVRYNQIYDMILRTLQNNLVTIHTDCPTYEKLGWLEVLANTAPSYAYLFDMQSLWTGTSENIKDGQRSSGLVPNIIPDYTHGVGDYDDSPAWGAATMVIPWLQYTLYRDTLSLVNNYQVMKDYLVYLVSREDNRGVITHGLGDWMAPAGNYRENVESAIYVWLTRLMRDIAQVLGKEDDSHFYSCEFDRVKNSYNKVFFDDLSNAYLPYVQVNQVLPLAFGIVADNNREFVFQSLLNVIENPGDATGKFDLFGNILPFHITVGDVGATYLWRVLGNGNQSSLVEKMILQPDEPSYYNFVLNGMSTMPEHWVIKESRSMNHDMYAGIMEWFYSSVGGIKCHTPGYKSFILKPAFDLKLKNVDCEYLSLQGKIASNWYKNEDKVYWKIVIPANTKALVYLPLKKNIKENRKNIDQTTEIKFIREEDGFAIYEFGSGCYNLSFFR